MGDIALKTQDSDFWAMSDAESLIQLMLQNGYTAKHIVITGGEPCIYDLTALTQTLEANGFQCQIETSGTYPILCTENTWVTVSPKVGMKGGLQVLEQAINRANEIKHPVAREKTLKRLISCFLYAPKVSFQLSRCNRLAKNVCH